LAERSFFGTAGSVDGLPIRPFSVFEIIADATLSILDIISCPRGAGVLAVALRGDVNFEARCVRFPFAMLRILGDSTMEFPALESLCGVPTLDKTLLSSREECGLERVGPALMFKFNFKKKKNRHAIGGALAPAKKVSIESSFLYALYIS